MKYRTFGRVGWPVSEIGYGMWGMGGWTGSDDAESLRSLQRAVELGCTFFDTAWAYGQGHSERLLGELVRAHPDRGLVVASKVPPKNMKWPGSAEYAAGDTYPADHIRHYTEESLGHLKLERLDLMQLHVWDDAWAADEGWQRAAERLKRDGLVRAFGISINRWQPQNVLKALATGVVDSVQVVYNIFDQAPEDVALPCLPGPGCRRHRPGALRRRHAHRDADARQPLARGRLAQRVFLARESRRQRRPRGSARPAHARRVDPARPGAALHPGVSRRVDGDSRDAQDPARRGESGGQ